MAIGLSFFWVLNPVIVFILGAYLSTALWNSAKNYKGKKIWKLSALTVSALGFTGIIVLVVITILAIMGIAIFY